MNQNNAVQQQLALLDQRLQLVEHHHAQVNPQLNGIANQLNAFIINQGQHNAHIQAQLDAHAAAQAQVQDQIHALQAQVLHQTQMMQQLMQGNQQILALINENIAGNVNIANRNDMFRAYNRVISASEPLRPILNDLAQIPDNFPANKTTLASLTSAQLRELLIFYGLNFAGNRSERYSRMSAHLGLG